MSTPIPVASTSVSPEAEALARAEQAANVAAAQADLYRRLLNVTTEEAAGHAANAKALAGHVADLEARVAELEGAAQAA